MNEKRRVSTAAWISTFLFWMWNIIFLAFVLLGYAPQVVPGILTSVQAGVIPPGYLVAAMIIIAIPIGMVALGATVLRLFPERLFALIYVVEGPSMLLILLWSFFIQQGNPTIAILLLLALIGILAFFWYILAPQLDNRPRLLAFVRLGALTILVGGAIYACAWIAFYIPPLVGGLVQQIVNYFSAPANYWTGMGQNIWNGIAFILGSVLMIFSGALLAVSPVVVPVLGVRAWLADLNGVCQSSGKPAAAACSAIPLAVALIAVALSLRQPQVQVFALLETPPQTPAQADLLARQSDEIRAGLLNAFLARYRYISPAGEVYHISEMYQWGLGASVETAQAIQTAYEFVVSPLLYQPITPPQAGNQAVSTFQADVLAAAGAYENLYDESILTGERETIVNAVRSTWNGEQAQASWQAVDDRQVYLKAQEFNVVENGDWAEIEMHEVYQNQTYQRQEVIYYFSLPESAVITGLWLGNSADRAQRFEYRVSPRGAAQAEYKQEQVRRVDPALLEQLGPRQYRLRVFPVEPITWQGTTEKGGPELHLWLTYQALAAGSGWPLPQLAEQANVYWDAESVRLVNQKPVPAGLDEWTPAAIPARTPPQPAHHAFTFPDGKSVRIRPAAAGDVAGLGTDLRLAVVLDRSRSMAASAGLIQEGLAELKQYTAQGQTLDVYLTSNEWRGEPARRAAFNALKTEDFRYLGGQNSANLIAQFAALKKDSRYAAILVLTDSSGYKLESGQIQGGVPDAPLWIVHLDGKFPLGYDDATLQAIQASGGGVAGSVKEALARFAIQKASGGTRDLLDGYLWSEELAAAPDPGFSKLAARRLITSEIRRNKGTIEDLATLDAFHSLAKSNGIVTPYSSMIVLVNQRQQTDLDALEQQADRFAREGEAAGSSQGASAFSIVGVPEPEEWLLLATAAILLGAVYLNRRRKGSRASS